MWAMKRYTGPYGETGHPDVTASCFGLRGELELKGDDKLKPEKLQNVRLRQWGASGSFVGSATNRDEVREWVRQFAARARELRLDAANTGTPI